MYSFPETNELFPLLLVDCDANSTRLLVKASGYNTEIWWFPGIQLQRSVMSDSGRICIDERKVNVKQIG